MKKSTRVWISDHPRILYIGLLSAWGVVFVAHILHGPVDIPFFDFLSGGVSDRLAAAYTLILQQVRLPRVVLGALVGFGLGMAGAVLQGYLRNPLAEPSVTGVSAVASLGAVIAIYYGLADISIWAVPILSMLAAFLSIVVLMIITGGSGGHARPMAGGATLTIILAGSAINSMAIALISLLMSLAPHPWAVTEMLFWTMGSLKDRSLADVWAIVPFMGIGSLILWRTGNSLALLTLGYDIAKNMGVDFRRLQWMIVFGVALCVGSAVALTGTIAFVGLVVPHVLRPFVGYHPGRLLLASGIGGSMFTMLADLMVQVLPTQPELHIGVLTALLGGPMFFALALKAGRQS